jgi:hypothetical protein
LHPLADVQRGIEREGAGAECEQQDCAG